MKLCADRSVLSDEPLLFIGGFGFENRIIFIFLSCFSLQKFFERRKKQIEIHTERYRSGHNGADSKSYGYLVVSSAGKPLNIRAFKIKNRIFFSVLSCFSLQKFFDRKLSEEKAD